MKFLLGKFAFLETDIQTVIHEHCTINPINILNSNLKRDFHLISSISVTSEPNNKVTRIIKRKRLLTTEVLDCQTNSKFFYYFTARKVSRKVWRIYILMSGCKGYCSKEDIVDITMNLTVPHPVLLVWTWGLWCKNQLGTFSDSGPVKNLKRTVYIYVYMAVHHLCNFCLVIAPWTGII